MGCYNDDVLFIDIPRTSGRWSVKQYLHDHLPDVLMPDDPRSKLPIEYVRLQDIERFTGRRPESFETILAVVRNPYEQQLSQMAFWAKRFLQGGRHVHDVNTWRYVAADVVNEDLAKCIFDPVAFEFQPRHLNLTGFVPDPRCDFALWYMQHYGFAPGQRPTEQEAARITNRELVDGRYNFWLTVDGKIPSNVVTLRAERLEHDLPRLIGPMAGEELPPPEYLNTSPHSLTTRDFYTPAAMRAVQYKFEWAFDHYYNPGEFGP
jgi:hypothetical protein